PSPPPPQLYTLSLHDALPILDQSLSAPPGRSAHADRGNAARARRPRPGRQGALHRLLESARLAGRRCTVDRALPQPEPVHIVPGDRKSTRLNSSHVIISYAVF